jgi:hypothetical protein
MSPMELNSMIVAPNACGCYISNLVNGTEYTFTVKSVDINGNKSVGVSKTITPQFIEKSTMKVELSPSTLEKTNQDVEVTVNFVADKVGTVKQLYYIEGVNAKIDDVIENGTDIFESKKFTVSANGTYTVATIDTAGRRELNFITITNIDKTAPAQVSNLVYSYSRNTNKILLTWINPTDDDFSGIIITYGKKDSSEIKTEPATPELKEEPKQISTSNDLDSLLNIKSTNSAPSSEKFLSDADKYIKTEGFANKTEKAADYFQKPDFASLSIPEIPENINYTLEEAADKIRELVEDLREHGINIQKDEMNFEKTFQVILKINKNEQ